MSDKKQTLEELMDSLVIKHAETERRINKEIDADIISKMDNPILGVQFKKPFIVAPSNPSLYFIIPNEFAERFCYYGWSPLLKKLLGGVLGLSKWSYGLDGKIAGKDDTDVNAFALNYDFLTYFTPLLGAFISDSFLDKYKTIVSLGLFYLVGMFMLSFSVNPNILGYSQVLAPIYEASPLNQTVIDAGIKFIPPQGPNVTSAPAWLVYTALLFLAFGTGGIKPCVSAHGGDQFLPQQGMALNLFFSMFYMSINVGAMLSGLFVTPLQEKKCFGSPEDCFYEVFIICSVVFAIAYFLFIFGKRYYRVVPPAGRFILGDLCVCGFTWMFKGKEHVESVYGKSIVMEAADLGKVLVAILPTPFFWMAFKQSGNLWQDSTDRLGKSIMNSVQINTVVNPLLIVILAPLFNKLVYPVLPKKFGLLQRICLGYFFTALSMVICGLIDQYVLARCTVDSSLERGSYYYGVCAYPQLDNTIWIIPYIIMTIGEVLISISGLNFVYEEVGKRTKSSSTALWLVGSSFGSFFTSRLSKFLKPGTVVNENHKVTFDQFYFICAGILMVVVIPQMIITYFYVYKADRPETIELEKKIEKAIDYEP
ncbi:POT family-domain-containing protein [Globomyces pollinis-pini]|nr:POT family-domain-containing protein [Globomyces pollinis-pini]